ncbi:PREDICTED: uncharacterized protein LOC109228583 [Nicotiana attenuata]|uniref:Uncharacterized protein n=1 Tax=Nicotiana attenuata TaxID=49451 RepID=A0A1J6I4N6_NICAT|nr:PREDICTED: uncharacterized protein LOC109228583 [Nicotiana attenuata]OIS99997.1 hypothetical protein A4A49_01440 [Nicotiana attenuata]
MMCLFIRNSESMALEKSPVGDLKEHDEQESSDWSKLSDDLKVEILCRLPEKPLIAFKRVAKDWYFLISYVCVPRLSPPSPSAPICGVFGPSFTCDPSKSSTVEFSPHGPYHCLFYQRVVQSKPDAIGSYLYSLPFTCTTKDLLDCCNGLLLISRSDYEPVEYLVCNPATRQTIPVPVNPKHKYSTLVDCSLVFDPSESLEYKIIRFVHSVGKATIRLLDVFSSDTGEWIEYELPLEPKVSGIGGLKSSVYLDGVVYRISGGGCLISIGIKSNPNLANLNAWATIEFPDQQSKKYVGSIGASRGHLYYFNRNESDFLLWTLKNENGNKWVLKHSISIYSLLQNSAGEYYCNVLGDKVWSTIQPCVLLPSSDDILLLETPWFLVTYKFKYQSFSWYDTRMRGCQTRRLGQSFPYSRSLVVLNSIINKHINNHPGSSVSFRMCSSQESQSVSQCSD